MPRFELGGPAPWVEPGSGQPGPDGAFEPSRWLPLPFSALRGLRAARGPHLRHWNGLDRDGEGRNRTGDTTDAANKRPGGVRKVSAWKLTEPHGDEPPSGDTTEWILPSLTRPQEERESVASLELQPRGRAECECRPTVSAGGFLGVARGYLAERDAFDEHECANDGVVAAVRDMEAGDQAAIFAKPVRLERVLVDDQPVRQ